MVASGTGLPPYHEPSADGCPRSQLQSTSLMSDLRLIPPWQSPIRWRQQGLGSPESGNRKPPLASATHPAIPTGITDSTISVGVAMSTSAFAAGLPVISRTIQLGAELPEGGSLV